MISIITIVKNDRGIAATLSGVRMQSKPVATEMIVVDASEPSLLADIREQYPEVRWFHFAPPVPNKSSIPEQRNFGVKQAQGDIIVFIDANCVPDEGWLAKLTEPIRAGSETMAAGSVRATDPNTRVNLNSVHTKGEYLSSSPTINLAFKKALWDEVGGFDESFLFGSDVDFTWRCADAGHRILFVREATVTHDWGGLKDEVRRSFTYGKARARLYRKHPKRRRELLGGSFVITAYTAYLVLLPLTLVFWWYPLSILIAAAKNFRDKPFKTMLLNLTYTLGFLRGCMRPSLLR